MLSSEEKIPWKTQAAIFGAGIFNFSMVPISSLIVALYVVELTNSNTLVGTVIGARSFLTLILSIHGGVLMDRLGTRRVMIGFASIAMVLPLLFPLSPWIPVLIVLQMLAGLADSMGWMGAQALSGRVMAGNPVYVGRMTFLARMGSFVGPLTIGYVWDLFGVWPTFITLSLWSAVGFIAILLIPPPGPSAQVRAPRQVTARDLVPRFSDYVSAFRLVAIPVVLLILLVTVARVGGTSIQSSFYVIYLESLDYPAATIGFLIGMAGLFASGGSLGAAKLTRILHPHWLVIAGVTITVLTIASTPLLGGIFVIFLIVISTRGFFLGSSQTIEISELGQAVDRNDQGKAVGLRTTVNRIAGTFLPPLMGVFADAFGLETSFLLIGACLLVLMVASVFLAVVNRELGPGDSPHE